MESNKANKGLSFVAQPPVFFLLPGSDVTLDVPQ